jgi:hypothetical protein
LLLRAPISPCSGLNGISLTYSLINLFCRHISPSLMVSSCHLLHLAAPILPRWPLHATSLHRAIASMLHHMQAMPSLGVCHGSCLGARGLAHLGLACLMGPSGILQLRCTSWYVFTCTTVMFIREPGVSCVHLPAMISQC